MKKFFSLLVSYHRKILGRLQTEYLFSWPKNYSSHLGLHCLLRPICLNTYSKYSTSVLSEFNDFIFAGQADSESEDTEMTEKLQSNEGEEEGNDQSNDMSQSEDENEPMESDNTKDNRERHSPSLHEKDSTNGRLENGHISPMSPPSPSTHEVMKKCNFPSDILTLNKVEESVCYQTGIPWTVSPVIPLPKGSSIGPYTGKMVALGDLKEREHILQV